MRRALASLLLVLFTFPVIDLILRAETPSSLPACCRLSGKHHCSMDSARDSSSSPAVKPISQKCLYYPATISVSGEGNVALLSGRQAIFGSSLSQAAILAQTEARRRVSFTRSRQKRGPPALS
ncbi:MAG: hypothetical protein ABSF22_25870 [Bryobacteraceae bacterium]